TAYPSTAELSNGGRSTGAITSSARIRPSPACSGTHSAPATQGTSWAIRRSAASIDSILPPKAKHSTENCAMLFPQLLRGRPVNGALIDGACQDCRGNRLDIIEMMQRNRQTGQRGIRRDGNDRGILGAEQWFRVGRAVDLNLGMAVALETLDQD